MPPEQRHPPRSSSRNTNPPSDSFPRDTTDSPGLHHQHHHHNPLHGAVASHFLAQPRDAYGGETWVDFLREASDPTRVRPHPTHTSTAPTMDPTASPSPFALSSRPSSTDTPSSATSSDRKRRLTTAESPMRRPSNIGMHSSSQQGSSSGPIVLESSPTPSRERPLPPPPSYPTSSNTPRPFRRESDLVLPQWQPDSDVTQCPVCSKYFTFLFRKHHCRKCGRVVCSQCSPHRITIPRQFIVHPPSDGSNSIIDLTGDDDMNTMSNFGPFRNPALGGGEEVRVCNPCVPDPNYSLPPQYPASSSHVYSQPHPPLTRPDYTSGVVPPYQRAHRSSSSVHTASHVASQGQTYPSQGSINNRRVTYHSVSGSQDRWPTPLPSIGHTYPSFAHHQAQNQIASRPIAGPYNPQPFPQRAGSGQGSVPGGNMFPSQYPVPTAQPPAIQQLNPRPRRQIAEEDECPICGGELPPKGPDGDDSARSQHIEECIALHSASPAPTAATRPQAQTSSSLPIARTRGMSSAGNGEGASSSHRHSHAARGMFPYTATEKDCVDEDGNDAECVICFEEFEAGDKMARLVCWCKFHEKCIREWWKMKGRGACPTHQLHEE